MSQIGAFIPQGQSAALSVTNTSTATPIQLPGFQSLQPSQVYAYNAGPYDAFLTWGASSSLTAVIPTAGTPKDGIMIPAGAVVVVTTAPNQYYAAISGNASASNLYLTPGEGN